MAVLISEELRIVAKGPLRRIIQPQTQRLGQTFEVIESKHETYKKEDIIFIADEDVHTWIVLPDDYDYEELDEIQFYL